jgi:hypothetical protein
LDATAPAAGGNCRVPSVRWRWPALRRPSGIVTVVDEAVSRRVMDESAADGGASLGLHQRGWIALA